MKCQTCGKELTHEEIKNNKPGDWICTCCKRVREARKEAKKNARENMTPSSPDSYPPTINPLENKVIELEEKIDNLLEIVEEITMEIGHHGFASKNILNKLEDTIRMIKEDKQ